jgi:hypothetical protein
LKFVIYSSIFVFLNAEIEYKIHFNPTKKLMKNTDIKTTLFPISFYLLFLVLGCFYSVPAQTLVRKIDSSWVLEVDKAPFTVKGVTFGYEDDVDNYEVYFKDLQYLGVNTIRTWGTNNNTKKLLDTAEKFNIKVLLGIWMRHGKPGMEGDDNFDYVSDKDGKEKMFEEAISTVEAYKNHPALLSWGIGNEVYLNTETDEEKKAYSLLLERICKKIKSIDPHHPITSVEAWTFGLDWWNEYVPSIDIYGINSYGFGVNILEEEIKKKTIDKPYVITEFGVTGEWDVETDSNGIKIEPNDQEKYDAIAKGYHDWVISKPTCLGAYVFHYGDSNNFVGPWLLTFFKGMYRPQYWAIREAYTGQKQENQTPIIHKFELPKDTVKSGTWIPVTFDVSDAEDEKIEYSFYYNQREGSRKLRDQLTPLQSKKISENTYNVLVPMVDTPIKVYLVAKDSFNNAGIATNSINVENGKDNVQPYLVPKPELPFYVYQEGEHTPYIPSAYMGGIEHIQVDLKHNEDVHNGKYAFKLTYNSDEGWYGLGLVDPADDWGEILGGYDLRGAKTFSFWAKASKDDIKATIGFGLIGSDKPYPDTAKVSKEIELGTSWKKYTLKLKKSDLSCIRSGLVIFSTGHWSYGDTHSIYLDDVVFE